MGNEHVNKHGMVFQFPHAVLALSPVSYVRSLIPYGGDKCEYR